MCDVDQIEELWKSCDALGAFFDQGVRYLDVREVYRRHKRAGHRHHFSRYILLTMERAKEWEQKQLRLAGNWTKKRGALLFRQVGAWRYDEYRDEYYLLRSPFVHKSQHFLLFT